jgi:hypothetical protein
LRERLEKEAQRAGEAARNAAASVGEAGRARSTGIGAGADGDPSSGESDSESRWLRDFLGDRAGVTPEGLLLRLVRSVRDDERASGSSALEARKAAKKRARKIALMSAITGPLAGPTRQLLHLYGDTATVCDLVGVHGLEKSDADVAAVMLVLWNITADLDIASAAMAGGDGASVTALVNAHLKGRAGDLLPATAGPRAIVSALSRSRDVVSDVTGGGARGTLGSVVRPGKRVKTVTERARPLLRG